MNEMEEMEKFLAPGASAYFVTPGVLSPPPAILSALTCPPDSVIIRNNLGVTVASEPPKL